MIVQPDFLDHWKTQVLTELLDDPCAPIYVIRLWGHCQNRKTHRFERVNPALIKAICKAPQKADLFESSMIEAGFLKIEGNEIVAHEWDIINASLIANWTNGKKGGRPRKKTHGLPIANPSKTHSEPVENPDVTDKRRGEEIDKIEDNKTKPSLPSEAVSIADLIIHHCERINPNAINISKSKIDKTRANWADSVEKANRIDKRSWEDLRKVFFWASNDSFWSTNVMSGKKLRDQYDKLYVQMNKNTSSTTQNHKHVSETTNYDDWTQPQGAN